jgi:hypothetical protein
MTAYGHLAGRINAMLVAAYMPFPSIGHAAVAGDAFRWVLAFWNY